MCVYIYTCISFYLYHTMFPIDLVNQAVQDFYHQQYVTGEYTEKNQGLEGTLCKFQDECGGPKNYQYHCEGYLRYLVL